MLIGGGDYSQYDGGRAGMAPGPLQKQPPVPPQGIGIFVAVRFSICLFNL